MMKKAICALLSAATVLSALPLTACDDYGEGYEDVDPNRTQLYIGNYYGGLGDGWLKEMKRRYEDINPDIQIMITNDKQPFLADSLINTIKTDKHQLYFTERQYYYDLVNDGKIANINDVVTEKLTKYGEDVSIADKIADRSLKDYYGGRLTNNEYYALPTYTAHSGIVYDVDLWEDRGFYIAEGSTDVKLVLTKGDNKAAGPDGVEGTIDDGMPTTYAQFKLLVTEIRKKNVTPFVWSGKIMEYQQQAATAWWCDYEGYDNFLLNFTFNGEYTFDGDSQPTPITEKNAYMLQKQQGKKYALQFVKDLVSNSNNYTLSSGGTTNDHLGAQYEYVSSYPDGKPIAMMLEADWWENEARDNNAFNDMVQRYGSKWAYGNRRFAFMPIPKTEGSAQGETVLSTSATCCFFVNANAGSKTELAKDFLQFCHTDEALKVFNTYTGICRPYKYTLSDDELSDMSHFSQYIYKMYNGYDGHDPVNVVHELSLSDLKVREKTYFKNWEWGTSVSGTPYNNPFPAFASSGATSVDAYFNGLYTYQSGNWSRFKL